MQLSNIHHTDRASLRPTVLLHTVVPLVLIAIPVFVHVWYLRTFAVSIPFRDEWEFWWSMKGLDEGNWHHAFWIPHNEHRLVMTRLFFFLLRDAAALDVTLAMYFSLLLAVLTLFALWRMARAAVDLSLWYFVPVSFVVFSLAQWENMLWGWQIAIYLMVCGSVWSLYLLSRPGRGSLVGAIVCAVVASLSFANGLMIWPTGVIYLLWARAPRTRLFGWLGAMVVLLLIYFRNYANQVTRPSPTGLERPSSFGELFNSLLTALARDPFELPALLFGSAGAVLSPENYTRAILFGLIILLLLLTGIGMLVRRASPWTKRPLPLVAVALFGCIAAFTIIAGRIGQWDKELVLTSRYITITLLPLVATYLLAVALAHRPDATSRLEPRVATTLCAIIVLLLLVGLPGGYRVGLVKGEEQRALRAEHRQIVHEVETRTDAELDTVYPKALRERLQYWQQHHLEPFTD